MMRRMLETDVDRRCALCHALAGAQIIRLALPAPVVDVELHRRIGFGGAPRVDSLLLELAWHHLAIDHAIGVLAAESVGVYRVLRNGANRFEHLDLFIAQ